MEAFSLLFGWGNFYSLELDFGFQGLKGAAFVLDADGFPLLYGFFEFAFYAFCDVLFILELRY